MKKNYIISICIPTYNRKYEIKRLLSEVFKKYPNSNEIEICVSDNRSDDGTFGEIKNFSKYSNLVANKNKSNLGFDNNILKVVSMATGRYIFFMGDDDLINFEYLDEIIKILKNHDDIDGVLTNYEIESKSKKKFILAYNFEKNVFNQSIEDVLKLGRHITFMSSIIIKRKLINLKNVKSYNGLKFMHFAILLDSLINSKNILIYKNVLIRAFDNGLCLDVFNKEKYFDRYLMKILNGYALRINNEVIQKFKDSIFDCIFYTLLFYRNKKFKYYRKRYKNKKVYFLLLSNKFYINLRAIKRKISNKGLIK